MSGNMKTTRSSNKPGASSAKLVRPWRRRIATVFLLGLCLGIGALTQSAKRSSGPDFRRPPGQLQADSRTMIAALLFLLDTDDVVGGKAGARESTNQNVAVATGQPHEMLTAPSNQISLSYEISTNPPVKS